MSANNSTWRTPRRRKLSSILCIRNCGCPSPGAFRRAAANLLRGSPWRSPRYCPALRTESRPRGCPVATQCQVASALERTTGCWKYAWGNSCSRHSVAKLSAAEGRTGSPSPRGRSQADRALKPDVAVSLVPPSKLTTQVFGWANSTGFSCQVRRADSFLDHLVVGIVPRRCCVILPVTRHVPHST